MISEILDKLIKLLGPIATVSQERKNEKDFALRTISNALIETHFYYKELNQSSGKRDQEREKLLVKYWSAAAIPIRRFDIELSNICDEKSLYWINPDNYDSDKIKSLGIDLENIKKAYLKQK